MNNITISGRLTADPELKVTTSGKNVCSFTVAVRRDKETTDFIPCTAWNKTAENISRYFIKGSMIEVAGSLQTRNYEAKDKSKRTAFNVLVDKFGFLESKAEKSNGESSANNPYTEQPQFQEIGDDEDLPF